MRLDKYLKSTRLVKRRATAQEMATVGAVRVNGRVCKPAADVHVGDVIDIAYPSRLLTVVVLCDDELALKKCAPESAYTVQSEKRVDSSKSPWEEHDRNRRS